MSWEATFDAKDVARFLAKTMRHPSGCLIWLGAKSRGKGKKLWYGTFYVKGKLVRAHKFACVALGTGTECGNDVDHTCHFSLCVEHTHLESVPPAINQERRLNRARASREDCGKVAHC